MRLLRKDVAREPVALWVLLPVHKMVRWRDLQRIGQDRRARMRRRAQANGLRAEIDRAVVLVVRDVMQCDVDRQGRATPAAAFLSRTPVPARIKHYRRAAPAYAAGGWRRPSPLTSWRPKPTARTRRRQSQSFRSWSAGRRRF